MWCNSVHLRRDTISPLCLSTENTWMDSGCLWKFSCKQAGLEKINNWNWGGVSSVFFFKFYIWLRGIATLFGNFIKGWKVPSDQSNSKTNDLVLLLKTIWRCWNCFLSPVAMDCMHGNGLKFEQIGNFFQVLMPRVGKILKKIIMVSSLW